MRKEVCSASKNKPLKTLLFGAFHSFKREPEPAPFTFQPILVRSRSRLMFISGAGDEPDLAAYRVYEGHKYFKVSFTLNYPISLYYMYGANENRRDVI